MIYDWNDWLRASWPHLVAGGRAAVPAYLQHPSIVGFQQTDLAEPDGQVRDWVLSLTDESRLHVHEHADGSLVAHRDKVDPGRGPLQAMWHWLTEAKLGRLTAVVGVLAIVVGLAGAASKK